MGNSLRLDEQQSSETLAPRVAAGYKPVRKTYGSQPVTEIYEELTNTLLKANDRLLIPVLLSFATYRRSTSLQVEPGIHCCGGY